MTDDEIVALIRPELEKSFGRHGLAGVDVVSRSDHDGEPALYLTVRFGPDAGMPSVDDVRDAAEAVDRSLVSRGEKRFAYTDFVFPKDSASRHRLQAQWRDLLRA